MRLSQTRRRPTRPNTRVAAPGNPTDATWRGRGFTQQTVESRAEADGAYAAHRPPTHSTWAARGRSARDTHARHHTAVLERPARRPPVHRPARQDSSPTYEIPRQNGRALVWKTAGAIGAFALVAAGIIAAIGPGWGLISHASAPPNQNCTLRVPANPLSAQGLATPYELAATDPEQGECRESNQQQMAFAQAAVLDPATGAISVYNPLVITRGTKPAAAPVVPKLPANAVVALWFGFNGANLRLQGTATGDLAAAQCVNGLRDSIFGQVSYCNAVQFFTSANALIQAHKLTPPALGMATDGLPCPTVRDFSVVDQDQSDNVTTSYLVTAEGRTAQNTSANMSALTTAGARAMGNGSDNGLLVALDRVLGCTPWMAPDLADPGKMATALPLNEMMAAMDQAAPVATVPVRDPMVLNGKETSLDKLNLYRAGVDQAPVASLAQAQQDQVTYCQQLFQIAPARLLRDQTLTRAAASPVPLVATNLFAFLAQRFNFTVSKQGLDCTKLVDMRSPIKLKHGEHGLVVDATIGQGGNNANTDGATTQPAAPAAPVTPGAMATPAATPMPASTPIPASTPTPAATATPGATPTPASTPAPGTTPSPQSTPTPAAGTGGSNDGH